MLLFKKVQDLQHHLDSLRRERKTIGFVPTMGALHEGHLSLIHHAVKETDVSVCSIFVNPAQFNDPADLKKYPRTPPADIHLLTQSGCHLLFMPPVEEVYPPGQNTKLELDFGNLDQPMEGTHRPGHFQGMATVVKRLLEIVGPDRLFMGQKDFQQFSVVQHMLRQLHSPVKLVRCPIVREKDGLAMSSRNVLLTPDQRALAPRIFQTLTAARNKMDKAPPRQIEQEALDSLKVSGMMTPEYFEIVDGNTLQPVQDFGETDFVVACTAVKLDGVRLIDNLILKENLR